MHVLKQAYIAFEVRRETAHSVRLVAPLLRPGDRVLDVGCGTGHVAAVLGRRGPGSTVTVDIADLRQVETPPLCLYDGASLPFGDGAFDVVLIGFVLHHVPNAVKSELLREARRVARRQILVLEDTPETPVDEWLLRRHGRSYARKIGSDAPYGFYTRAEWLALFTREGLRARGCPRIGRLTRGWSAPWSRSAFLLEPESGAVRAFGDRPHPDGAAQAPRAKG